MFHHILTVVDGSPDCERALAEATDLAQSNRASLTIVSAASPSPLGGLAGVPTYTVDQIEAAHQAILRRAAASVPGDVTVRTILSRAPIHRTLKRFIQTGEYDLLVIGSSGRRTGLSALFGRGSHWLSTASPTAVLVMSAEPRRAVDPSAIQAGSSLAAGEPFTAGNPPAHGSLVAGNPRYGAHEGRGR